MRVALEGRRCRNGIGPVPVLELTDLHDGYRLVAELDRGTIDRLRAALGAVRRLAADPGADRGQP
jgi:hypothetical protein